MFAGLSGIADKFSSFIREPVTPLGTSIHDAIYATSYGSPNYQKLTDMVLSCSDPDALEEVWFVLSKAMDSSKNEEIRSALKLADYLIKHTGASFHNTCTPLFMRRLKDMIITKAKTGGADNMHLMNEAREIVRVWGEGFLPYASQGRGKVIVEGYQDMQRSGIRFPAPSGEENKWVPMVKAPTSHRSETMSDRISSSVSSSSSSIPSKRVSDVDPKELYRNVKRLVAKLDEEGIDFFDNEKAASIAEESQASQKALMVMIDRETTRGNDENLLMRLLTLNDMCQQVNKLYNKYKEKKAALAKKNDGWSDDEDMKPAKDDWSDDEPKPRKARKPTAPVSNDEPSVQVRSTRRRPAKQAEQAEEPEPPKQSGSDDLLGLGLWDEAPAAPAPARERPSKKPSADDWGFDDEPAPRRAPKKVSKVDDLFDDDEPAAPRRPQQRKPSADDWGFDDEPAPRRAPKKVSKVDDLFDDDDEPAPRRPQKKASKVDDLFDDDEPAPRRPQKKVNKVDDLFADDEPAPRRPQKKASTVDDLFADDQPAAPRRAPKSRQPTSDDWGFDDITVPQSQPAPVDPFSMMDFSTPAAPAPAPTPAPAPAPKPAKSAPKDAFEDLFSL